MLRKAILPLILLVFFLKGAFLATLRPIFSGQDESRHYSTIQFLNEPKEKNWPITEKKWTGGKAESISQYNYSREIKGAIQESGIDAMREEIYSLPPFSRNFSGINEEKINRREWKPYITEYPPNIAGTGSLYHQAGKMIEKFFSQESILVRFFSIRLFSVLLGTLAVYLFFLTVRASGFSRKNSLLLAAILAFQPKFSEYLSNVNYDALLIPLFFLFTFGGVLALKNGLDFKNLLIMSVSAALAFFTKGTGLILAAFFPVFLLYFFHNRIKKNNPGWLRVFWLFFLIALFFLALAFRKYLPLEKGFLAAGQSLIGYLDENLTPGRLALAARTYWGTLSWTESWILSNFTEILKWIELLGVAGLIGFFLSRKKPYFLPERKFMFFFLGVFLALEVGIRMADWRHFAATGNFELGTPGRYFLPALGAHLVLIFSGWGTLFDKIFSRWKLNWGEKYFEFILSIALILLFALSLHLIFNAMIFRYYL